MGLCLLSYCISVDRLIFTKLAERLTGKASLGALRHYIVVYWHKMVLSWPFVDGFKVYNGAAFYELPAV